MNASKIAGLNEHIISLNRQKNYLSLKFDDSEEYEFWLDILSPYLVQSDIYSKFQFQKVLGEGSYGKVLLANIRPEKDTNLKDS